MVSSTKYAILLRNYTHAFSIIKDHDKALILQKFLLLKTYP